MVVPFIPIIAGAVGGLIGSKTLSGGGTSAEGGVSSNKSPLTDLIRIGSGDSASATTITNTDQRKIDASKKIQRTMNDNRVSTNNIANTFIINSPNASTKKEDRINASLTPSNYTPFNTPTDFGASESTPRINSGASSSAFDPLLIGGFTLGGILLVNKLTEKKK